MSGNEVGPWGFDKKLFCFFLVVYESGFILITILIGQKANSPDSPFSHINQTLKLSSFKCKFSFSSICVYVAVQVLSLFQCCNLQMTLNNNKIIQ